MLKCVWDACGYAAPPRSRLNLKLRFVQASHVFHILNLHSLCPMDILIDT